MEATLNPLWRRGGLGNGSLALPPKHRGQGTAEPSSTLGAMCLASRWPEVSRCSVLEQELGFFFTQLH